MKTPAKPSRPRWLPALLVTAGFLLALVLLLLLWSFTHRQGGGAVLTINGAPITAAHEQLYLDNVRAQTSAYFHAAYGADTGSADFWQTEFDGQTPAQYQQALARANLVRDTVERQLARAHGVDAAVTLTELEQAREARNQSGGIKYGPDQYGLMEFIAQTQSQARDDLKTALLAGELSPTEDDLRGLYEQMDDSALLDMGYSASVGVFAYAAMKLGDYPEALPGAFALVDSLWDGRRTPQEVLTAVQQETGLELNYWSVDFDTASLQKDDELLPRLAEGCREVAPGDFSPVWEVGLTQGIAVVLEKDDRGRADFEDARTILTNRWINEQYETYLEAAVAAAVISEA